MEARLGFFDIPLSPLTLQNYKGLPYSHIILETAVGSQKPTETLDAPSTIKKSLITPQGDYELFDCTTHANIFHICFAPNCRF